MCSCVMPGDICCGCSGAKAIVTTYTAQLKNMVSPFPVSLAPRTVPGSSGIETLTLEPFQRVGSRGAGANVHDWRSREARGRQPRHDPVLRALGRAAACAAERG